MGRQPTAIDLFSGAGGLTEGLKWAGFDIRWAIDNEEHCEATYRRNHEEVDFTRRDIRDIEPPELELDDEPLDLIAGGPPCPTFSVIGRSKINSLDDSNVLIDDRHYLFENFIQYVKHYQPKAFLLENVVGMQSTTTESGENVVERIKRNLRDTGYRVATRTVDAADYGVPQRRDRLFFLGNRLGKDNPVMEAWATHREPRTDSEKNMKPARGPDEEEAQSTLEQFGMDVERSLGSFRIERDWRDPWVTVADAIFDLPPVSPVGAKPPKKATEYTIPAASEYQQWARNIPSDEDWEDRELHNHKCRGHNMHDLTLYKLLGEGVGWSTRELDDRFHRYRSDVFEDQYTKQDPQKPASTVTAHIEKDGHMSIHPREARSFTVREAARLQSFKDTYVFPVSQTMAFKQVGNAVPPLLAEALGTAIREEVLMDSGS